MMTYPSSSSEETKRFASAMAEAVLASGPGKHATIIALKGDLGAGKTTFTQGFFKGLGIKKVPNSPTFILMRRAALRGKKFKNVFHMDAYRIKDPSALHIPGLPELFRDPANIFLIEWPERIQKLLPRNKTVVRFSYGKNPEERRLTVD